MKNLNKKICVIFIINNINDLLEKSIKSIINQKYISEIFFINPSDIELRNYTPEINEKIKVSIINNLNVVENINYCISISSADFISIICSDELLFEDSLDHLLKPIEENNKLNLIWGFSQFIDKSFNFLGYSITDCKTDFYQNLINPNKEIRSSSFLIRKSIFTKLGYLNKRFENHFFLEFILRLFKYDKNSIKSIQVCLSQIQINKIDKLYYLDFEKDVELLELNLNIIGLNNNKILENRIYYYISSFGEEMFLKKISNKNISIKTKKKLISLQKEYLYDFDIQKDGLTFNKEIPIQIKSILNSRNDLIQKKFHLEENEELFCMWLLRHGFREYPSLLENLDTNNDFLIWLNKKRKNQKLSRINLAILNSNKIFKIIGKEKYKLFEIFLRMTWYFLPYKLPRFQNKFLNLRSRIGKFKNLFKKYLRTLYPKKYSYSYKSKKGINLIGYASHALGIGEDLRSTVYALNTAKINTSIIDFPPGSFKGREEKSLKNRIQTKHDFKITIFCLTAEETLRYINKIGRKNLLNKYVIGYWPWELPLWPKPWINAINFVDEIWVSSNHIRSSLIDKTDKTIKVMPLCIDQEGYSISQQTEKERIINRSKFNLIKDAYYICYSFDQNSYIERKNPWDALRTFQMAFPPLQEDKNNFDVRLLIKTFPNKNESFQWKHFKEIASLDSRILIIEKNMSRQNLLELYGCCDVFLSLHKAEGYGRCLGEALQLGLDLVATNWSGNVDFCKGQLFHPVTYKLKPLKPYSYPHWANQFWAEPDIYNASKLLRHVIKKRKINGLPNKKFSEEYKKYFSSINCGNRYKKRIDEINLFI